MGDRLARHWEALPGAAQFGLALAVWIAILWPGHVLLLNQPVLRGLLYAIFWGILFSLGVLFATRSEIRKRAEREGRDGG
jgi:hypothetical protein